MPMHRTSIVEGDVRRILDECQEEQQRLSGKTPLLTGGSRSRYIPSTEKFKKPYTTRIGLQEGLRRVIDSFNQIEQQAS